jgi:hypothetical protein
VIRDGREHERELEHDEERELLQAADGPVIGFRAAHRRRVDGEVEEEERADGDDAGNRVQPPGKAPARELHRRAPARP